MRILLISQWFDPEPTFKGLLFADALARRGHAVTVLTGFPNYPGGQLYPGYKLKLWQREKIGQVEVLRVPLYPSHDGRRFHRAMNYVSFAVAATVRALLLKSPDVVYLYHPPGTAALPALALRFIKQIPYLIDIQDMWPDTLAATGMMNNRHVLSFIGGWMKWIYSSAAHVTVLSAGFKKLLVERGVPQEKISVIPNWTYDTARAPGSLRMPLFPDGFNVVFAGTMGPAQALDVILRAAALLRDEAPDVRFILVGSGIEESRLKAEATKLGLNRVVFVPRRPPSEMSSVFDTADALLVHLRRNPLFATTIPSKTQAYLLAGVPILMGVEGDAKDMVETAGAGFAFVPESAESLAKAIIRLRAMPVADRHEMGRRGAQYYHEELSIKVGADRFCDLFKKIATERIQRKK